MPASKPARKLWEWRRIVDIIVPASPEPFARGEILARVFINIKPKPGNPPANLTVVAALALKPLRAHSEQWLAAFCSENLIYALPSPNEFPVHQRMYWGAFVESVTGDVATVAVFNHRLMPLPRLEQVRTFYMKISETFAVPWVEGSEPPERQPSREAEEARPPSLTRVARTQQQVKQSLVSQVLLSMDAAGVAPPGKDWKFVNEQAMAWLRGAPVPEDPTSSG